MAVRALAVSRGLSPARCSASEKVIPSASAIRSTWPIVVSPIPRLGTLTIRFNATVSSGLTSARR